MLKVGWERGKEMSKKWHQKTWDDLTEEQKEAIKKVSDKYDDNLKNMIKYCEAGNKKAHLRCIKIEKRLEDQGVALRKEYGVFAHDPCPLDSRGKLCDSCSGLYMRVGARGKSVEVKDKALLPKGTWVYECRMHPSKFSEKTLDMECLNKGIRTVVK